MVVGTAFNETSKVCLHNACSGILLIKHGTIDTVTLTDSPSMSICSIELGKVTTIVIYRVV